MIRLIMMLMFAALPMLRTASGLRGVVSVDVSYFQVHVNQLYRRLWFIFRGTFGNWVDPAFDDNYRYSAFHSGRRHWRRGFIKLHGFTVYVVFQPGQDSVGALRRHIEQTFYQASPYMCIMFDIEGWRGSSWAISGNHSKEIADQIAKAAEWLGRDRVWIYFNAGDGAEIAPRRPSWIKVILAAYASVFPSLSGPGRLFGIQYTDGSTNWPVPEGLPRSTPPFGNCDHDFFPHQTGQSMARACFGETKPVKHKRPKPLPKHRRYHPAFYTVKENDTLSEIASAHHLTLPQLERLNLRSHPNWKTRPDRIFPGEKVRVG